MKYFIRISIANWRVNGSSNISRIEKKRTKINLNAHEGEIDTIEWQEK